METGALLVSVPARRCAADGWASSGLTAAGEFILMPVAYLTDFSPQNWR